MTTLTVGSRVRVKDTYLDEERTRPLLGTVMDVFPRPDWNDAAAFAVIFDHNEPGLPPGGEFTADRLETERLGEERASESSV